jgi:hypothetical protein
VLWAADHESWQSSKGIDMASASRQTAVSGSRFPSAEPVSSSASDQEIGNFNLRDVLADMTVRETSFAEFLNALRQAGRRPPGLA